MNAEPESNTRLRGRWFAWSMWILTVCLAVFSITFVFLNDFASFPDPFCCSGFPSILTQSMALACSTVGVLIVSHRFRNSIGWILIFSGFGISLNFFTLNYSIYTGITQPGSLPFGPVMAWLASWIWLPPWWLLLTFFLLLFPDGKLPSQRWQPVMYFVVIVLAANVVVRMFKPGPLTWGMPTFENPFGIGGAFGDALRWADGKVLALLLIGVFVSALSLLVRFIGATNIERRQIKWLAYAGSMAGLVVIVATGFLYGNKILWNPWVETILFLPFLGIPISVGIAILKHHLFNIDLLINRTLVYFTMIAFIAGLYILVVGTLSSLFQNQSDLAAPLVALLIVVVLAPPLRRNLQNGVNRLLRFDPGRRDESQVVAQKPPEQSDEAEEAHVQNHLISEADSSPYTRLDGRRLLIARLTWITVVLLATIIHIAAAPVAFDLLRTPCYMEPCDTPFQTASAADSTTEDQASREFGAWYHTILEAGLRLLTLGVSLLIFWRRSDDWMALLASMMLVAVFAVFSPSPMMLANAQPLWHWPLVLLRALALASTVGLFYLFPDGRFVPRWTRWLAIALLVFIGALAVAGAPFQTGLPVFLAALTTGAGFQVYRYRRVSSPLQRQQTKWVVLGLTGMILPMLVFFLFAFFNPSLNPLRSNEPILSPGAIIFTMMVTFCVVIPLCFLPLTLAFSILRYRLWDVDILINRTLVYGALTASVIGLYVLIVGGLGAFFQTQNNLPGIVIAILSIAFLTQPLRQRLQRIANRLVPVLPPTSTLERTKPGTAILEEQGAADTKLRGHWLLLARLAWVSVLLTLTAMYVFGFFAMRETLSTICDAAPCSLRVQIRHPDAGEKIVRWPGPPVGFADRLRPDQIEALETLGLTLDQYGWLGALQMGFPALVLLLIAAGLFWWRSDDWMALFASVMVATFPMHNMPLAFNLMVHQPAWEWVDHSVNVVAFSCLLIFPLIFPSGQFVPRWTRWMALYGIAAAVIGSLLGNTILEVFGDVSGRLFIGIIIVLLPFVIGLYAQLYRYFRVARPAERQQFKWVVVGLVGTLVIQFVVLIPLNALLTSPAFSADPARALVLSAVPDTLWQINNLFIAVCIVISVLRYRLWDIDIIINRTLVYSALTGIVVSAFVILVGFLSVIFQSRGNSIIAIIATGLVALLFNPLRQRLQRGINHLMYGDRDEPYTALSRLGRRLETSLAPESVLPTVVTTVRDVLRLPYVAIYLQQDSQGYKIVAESASPLLHMENGRIRVPGIEREGRCIPLIHQGETLGYIVLGPRAPNEAFSTTDLHLLQDLAPQVGVAVHAVRLTADLQRSRERLVMAREEERRRLRRDLHDDLAPTLASLGLTASTAADLISSNPATATALVKELQTELRATVANIRRLVYDLRPPTLDELGLLAAVRERAAQYSNAPAGFHVTVESPAELPTLPAAVEVAAYRIVQEALENVSKHARARQCSIRFADHNGLEIEITDDGLGLPAHITPGVGLQSMRERAEELGGTSVIGPASNGGTRVLAYLPIGDFHGTIARPDRG